MKIHLPILFLITTVILHLSTPIPSHAWHDETHLAVAKVAGYYKWYNAAGPDIAKIKAGNIERHNHWSNNSAESVITAKMVMDQVDRYNKSEPSGHLYGAIIASFREYIKDVKKGKFAEYHLAYCAHYIGDLSMPLHNTEYNAFNKKNHTTIDGTIEDEVLENLEKIRTYPITIKSEEDLAKEIARIANLSKNLGYKLEAENRLLTKEEAYIQLGHSASLFKAVLGHAGKFKSSLK